MSVSMIELYDPNAVTPVTIDLVARKIDKIVTIIKAIERLDKPTDAQLAQLPKLKADVERLRVDVGKDVVTVEIKTPLNGQRLELATAMVDCERSAAGWDKMIRLAATYIARVPGHERAVENAGGIESWLLRIRSLELQRAFVDAVSDACLIPPDAEKN